MNRSHNNYSSFENNGQNNDLYTVNYGSDISQILKEVNSLNNVIPHHVQEVKTERVSICFSTLSVLISEILGSV